MVCCAEQVIGCDRETAILFGNLRGYFRRAWWRFRATSSPPLRVGDFARVSSNIRRFSCYDVTTYLCRNYKTIQL